MTETPQGDEQQSCGSSCQSCWAKLGLIPADGLSGWRLVLAAAGAFFSPLLQAILGMVLVPMFWHSPHARLIGGLGGLALGLVDSIFLVWCIRGTRDR